MAPAGLAGVPVGLRVPAGLLPWARARPRARSKSCLREAATQRLERPSKPWTALGQAAECCEGNAERGDPRVQPALGGEAALVHASQFLGFQARLLDDDFSASY